MMDHDDDEEVTRLKCKLKRGDGPDRRGEITVEVVRERSDARQKRVLREVELPDGTVVETQVEDRVFAEFYHELDRAGDLLESQLGLSDDGEEEE